jgi:hypothetical protein
MNQRNAINSRDTSKGQGDPLGIFGDKTGFWTLIEGEEGCSVLFHE